MNRLLGLGAALAISLVVAGSSSAAANVPLYGALIEHWDGTVWTQVPAPVASESDLYEVVAVSAEDVWAFGLRGERTPMALHLRGSAWKQVAVPAPKGTTEIYLIGAAVESATDIWVVGYRHGRKARGYRTLIEHWNG